MRFILRAAGLILLAAAFAALIVDGTRSVAVGHPALLPLGETVARFAPGALDKLHTSVEHALPPLWDPVLVTILLLPTWAVLGAAGLGFMAVTRQRQPKIGYVRR